MRKREGGDAKQAAQRRRAVNARLGVLPHAGEERVDLAERLGEVVESESELLLVLLRRRCDDRLLRVGEVAALVDHGDVDEDEPVLVGPALEEADALDVLQREVRAFVFERPIVERVAVRVVEPRLAADLVGQVVEGDGELLGNGAAGGHLRAAGLR